MNKPDDRGFFLFDDFLPEALYNSTNLNDCCSMEKFMKNIVLIGFMGTGKTSTGRVLARRLGRPFIDVDRKIEGIYLMSVSDIFAKYGEKAFRQTEKEIIIKVAKYTNTVIATGGGTVLLPENLFRLRNNGIIVSLAATTDKIVERIGKRRFLRPLLPALLLTLRLQCKNCWNNAGIYIQRG